MANDRDKQPASSVEKKPRDDDEVRFTLRGAFYLFSLIDQARGRRAGKISRNTWILEAITEKLKKEQES